MRGQTVIHAWTWLPLHTSSFHSRCPPHDNSQASVQGNRTERQTQKPVMWAKSVMVLCFCVCFAVIPFFLVFCFFSLCSIRFFSVLSFSYSLLVLLFGSGSVLFLPPRVLPGPALSCLPYHSLFPCVLSCLVMCLWLLSGLLYCLLSVLCVLPCCVYHFSVSRCISPV